MKLAALVSGGKDSVYAVYLAEKQGHDMKFILSVIPETNESYMFHYPNASLTSLQSESMGIPRIVGATKGEKEKELEYLEKFISKVSGEVGGLVTGAIASKYQASRIKKICDNLNIESVSPLWGRDLETYWDELLDNGFEIIITSVSAHGLGKEWLGRKMGREAIADLKVAAKKYKINLAGEGGEFETLVLNCPLFKKRIKIIKSEPRWDSRTETGQFIVTEARLE